MRVFVLGKRGSIVHLAEDSVAGFRAAGHDVRLGITRDPRLNRSIDALLASRRLGVPRAALIVGAIARFAPELIVTISPYLMPPSILERVAAMPGRAPLVGWVGDRFGAEVRAIAELHDAVAYSDTGLLALHQSFGFRPRAAYLPYAANPRLDAAVPDPQERRPELVFVANPTSLRREIVGQISAPISLYGEGWRPLGPMAHHIDARRVGVVELGRIYRSYLAVLNIRNEVNVLGGLNQRHFDPYVSATPVLSDDQPDIAQCFEPAREMLIYRDTGELNEAYARLKREPTFAQTVGERGQRRVLAEHTYAHRLEALARLGGV